MKRKDFLEKGVAVCITGRVGLEITWLDDGNCKWWFSFNSFAFVWSSYCDRKCEPHPLLTVHHIEVRGCWLAALAIA